MGETTACEQRVDYAATAQLMMEALGLGREISPARLEWLYVRAFSLGTTVVALHDGNSKIGQIALVRQMLQLNGRHETAAQLVDLFVKQGIRFAIGMPNVRALGVNAHFLNQQPPFRLDRYELIDFDYA